MTITRQATTLQALGPDRIFVPERVIARIILDRHMKRGKLDAAELAAEISQAITKARALCGSLAQAASDALAEQKSGSDDDYARAHAILDEIA